MGTTRDYYADLELPPTADIPEIKKQFRKLALKYHPDRNPGKEQDVNSKFQIIQSAHEMLTDPEQKAKYDATRTKSRYPTASGVRGNPWANMGSQYPPPPRRNPNPGQPPRNPPSGAQRWHTRFSAGVPPTAKQESNPTDAEAKKNAARAFENMRKARDGRPVPPPPPPPRTESARQRQEASFGARKAGFHPRSAMPGDEPPVTSTNYASRANPGTFTPKTPEPKSEQREQRQPRPNPMPDPLHQFREKDSFADLRQSTPYSTHGGEKTNPFDGVPIGRAKSTRETTRRTDASSSDDGDSPAQRHRSSSVPNNNRDESAAGIKQPGTNEQTQIPADRKFAKPSRTRTGLKNASASQPTQPSATNDRPPQDQGGANGNSSKSDSSGPSMYDKPFNSQNSHSFSSFAIYNTYASHYPQEPQPTQTEDHYGSLDDSNPETSPSGRQKTPLKLTPFEKQQHKLLDQLIANNAEVGMPGQRQRRKPGCPDQPKMSNSANLSASHSFTFNVNDDTFARTTSGPNNFARNSVDGINTRFVNDEKANNWHFSAGGSKQDPYPRTRSQSSGRMGHSSPNKRPAMHRTDTSGIASEPDKPEGGFDPDEWKFEPQIFEPKPNPTATGSPTRPSRAGSKKAKSAKTAGTAAVVGDSSSDEDDVFQWRGRRAQAAPNMADSPQAMDVDSPPRPTAEAASPPHEPNGVRNINVEPSRPEWRPGNVEGAKEDTKPVEVPLKPVQQKPFNPNNAGSEDSEEFRATLADLKNVAPFTKEEAGLKSFTDLKDELPFESKPSEEIPIHLQKAQPLVFPTPPMAPRLPPTVAINDMKPNTASWEKYVKEFQAYLVQWDTFNAQVVDHFATRKAIIAQRRESEGFSFLDARGDGGVQEYYNWVQQDNDVRRRWIAACGEHEERFREFMAFRQKMK